MAVSRMMSNGPFPRRRVSVKFMILLMLTVFQNATTLCLNPVTHSSRLQLLTVRRLKGTDTDEAFRCAMESNLTKPLPIIARPPPSKHSKFRARLHKFVTKFERAIRTWIITTPSFYELLRNQAKTHLVVRPGINVTVESLVDPTGPRWAIAGRSIDLSGVWVPVVTPEFKKALNSYLTSCGQTYLRRTVVLNALSLQREVIRQINQGRELEIVAINPVGQWNRTLIASGADKDQINFTPFHQHVVDPEGEKVQIEAWWEKAGTVHHSWLRGNSKVQGGEFETLRYLDGQDMLICESIFHPPGEPKGFSPAHVVWRFSRANG